MKKNTAFLSLLAAMSLASCGGNSGPTHHLVFVEEEAATCVKDGVKEHYVCTDASCEHKFFDKDGNEIKGSSLVITALGHDYEDDPELRYLVSDADCEHKAVYHQACFRCGREGTSTFESGEAKGHRYGTPSYEQAYQGATYEYKGHEYCIEYVANVACLDCQKTFSETKTGTFSVDAGHDSTCLLDGEGTITLTFGDNFGGTHIETVTLPATGHDISGVGYSSDDERHWKECSLCHEHIEVGSHELSPSHDESYHWESCSVCERIVGKTSHAFGKPVISIVSKETRLVRSTITCECGYEKTEDKTGTLTITKEPTCTEKGSATISATFSEEFGGAFSGDIEVAAKGHVSDNVYVGDENGHHTSCTVCGAKMNESEHVHSAWTVLDYPTDEEAGHKSGTCDVCEYVSVVPFEQCRFGEHEGKHYDGVPATKTESGVSGYSFCDTCHKIILDSAHVEGDGEWAEAGAAETVDPSHPAYLEPTVTASDVIAAISSLDNSLSIGRVPDSLDKQLLNTATSLLNAYLGKEGSSESDITNLETLHGAQNTLGMFDYSEIATGSGMTNGRYNVYGPSGKSTVTRNLRDEENGVDYGRVDFTDSIAKYSTATFLYGGIFEGVETDVQVLVRTNFDTSFYIYANGTRSDSTTAVNSGVWTTITISQSLVKIVQEEMAKEEPPYNTIYLSNNTAIEPGNYIEVASVNSVSGFDLKDYKVFSNEGYGTGWQFGGLTGTMSTNLHGKGWFAGTATPTEHPSYRDYFLETKISNNSGADKTSEDLLVSNSYYGGLYFGTGSSYTFSETVTEVFFMVYSNEEVSIKYSNFGDIVRTTSRKTVVRESKIYKGWNAIHVDIEGSKACSIKGHAFQIVPEVWSTTLELTMSAMFYKTI